MPVTALFCEGDEAPQQDALNAKLEPQRTLLVHVSCKISVHHHASPGQGCAICCSISDIDFSVVRGHVRRAVTQYGANHVEGRTTPSAWPSQPNVEADWRPSSVPQCRLYRVLGARCSRRSSRAAAGTEHSS